MTICVAAMCRFNYRKLDTGADDWGLSVVTASDRLLTDAGMLTEYEPLAQGKWATIPRNVLILVSDSLDIHSELLQQLKKWADRTAEYNTYDAAKTYADYLCQLKSARAVRYALGSNYGFSAAEFAELQGRMDPNVVADLNNQMTEYERRVNAEAIVAGCDPDNSCHIFHVDPQGIVHCHDDIGFLCIGAGRRQANAQFIQRGYSNRWFYYPAIGAAYAAKKAAEAVGGVGKEKTDLHQITRDGVFNIHPERVAAIESIYQKYSKRQKKIEESAVTAYMQWDGEYIRNAMKSGAQAALAAVVSMPAQTAPGAPAEVPSGAPSAQKPVETPPRKRQPRSQKPSR